MMGYTTSNMSNIVTTETTVLELKKKFGTTR